MDKRNMSEALSKFIDSAFVRIDGALVKKGMNPNTGVDGFIWGDQWYKTEGEVRDAMKGICKLISLRIVNPNGEVKTLDSTYTECYHNGESGYDKWKKDQEV